jgi:hypothetical protein
MSRSRTAERITPEAIRMHSETVAGDSRPPSEVTHACTAEAYHGSDDLVGAADLRADLP